MNLNPDQFKRYQEGITKSFSTTQHRYAQMISRAANPAAKQNISIERLIQIPDKKNKKASIVIITHQTNEFNANKCLKSLKSNKNILKTPTRIRLF